MTSVVPLNIKKLIIKIVYYNSNFPSVSKNQFQNLSQKNRLFIGNIFKKINTKNLKKFQNWEHYQQAIK